MGWCKADFKTDLNYFYTKDEWISSGVVIQMDPSQRPQHRSVLMEHWSWPGSTSTKPHTACPAPQLLHTRTVAGCEHEDNPACSSLLYLEFGTQRICVSTTLLIQGLKGAPDKLSHWRRWRKGMAFFQLAAFNEADSPS